MLLPLLTYFESYLPFDKPEKQLFVGRVRQRQLKRRQAILQAGFPCLHYTFVVSGCLRLYALDQKGTEHNLLFAAENEWIADISSFHSGQPSQLFIAALKPAIILQLDQQDLYSVRHQPKRPRRPDGPTPNAPKTHGKIVSEVS